MKLRAALALPLLLVPSCSPVARLSPERRAATVASPEEQALLGRYSRHARRDGSRLLLFEGANVEPLEFVDRPCVEHDGDCIEYRLDAVFHGPDSPTLPIFGLRETYYEGQSYTLVSRHESVETGEPPVQSPDGQLLAAAASSDSYPPDTGITLLRLRDGRPLTIRRISTEVLTNYRSLRWVGSGCIAFSASDADDGTYGAPEPFALVEAEPEWRIIRGNDACDRQNASSAN